MVPLLLLLAGAPGDNDVGMNVHNGTPAYISAAADLGVTWVRLDGNWFQLEPQDDVHQWTALDAAVNAAHAQGLNVYLTLAYTPSWVPRHGDTDGSFHNDVPNASTEWVDFVGDAVTHYRALGVTHFGIWNEPNLQNFFEGTLSEYTQTIANPGAAAVRAACSDCLVLGPDLAHVGDVDDYLEDVLQQTPGAWDIIAHHLYNDFAETGWQIWDGDGFINALEQQRFPFTRRSLREILDGAGWTGDVWITETGYRATPPGDATEENFQAIYVRRVLEEQLARAWYTNSFFYEIHDCGPDQPTCTIDGFGLMRATSGQPGSRIFPGDFRLKPAFAELKTFITNNPSVVGGSPPPECGDGIDNDGDMRIDTDDRGCSDPLDDDESDDPPRLQLIAPMGAVTVDGDLSDFGPAAWINLGEPEWRGNEPLDGAGDLAVRAAARWSGTTLYIGVEVDDDNHVNDHPPQDLWQGDSLQLAFDVGQSGGQAYDAVDDHEINFAISGGAESSFRFVGPAGATDAWTFAARRSGSTTTYEVGLPGAVLPGVTFSSGTIIGFSFLVNEDDGPGRVGWMEWTPGIGQGKEPELFGEIALGDAPPPPADAGVMDTGGEDAAPDAAPDAATADSAMDAGSTPLDAAVNADAGLAKDSGATVRPDAGNAVEETAACGCAAAPDRSGSGLGLLLLLALLLWRRYPQR